MALLWRVFLRRAPSRVQNRSPARTRLESPQTGTQRRVEVPERDVTKQLYFSARIVEECAPRSDMRACQRESLSQRSSANMRKSANSRPARAVMMSDDALNAVTQREGPQTKTHEVRMF